MSEVCGHMWPDTLMTPEPVYIMGAIPNRSPSCQEYGQDGGGALWKIGRGVRTTYQLWQRLVDWGPCCGSAINIPLAVTDAASTPSDTHCTILQSDTYPALRQHHSRWGWCFHFHTQYGEGFSSTKTGTTHNRHKSSQFIKCPWQGPNCSRCSMMRYRWGTTLELLPNPLCWHTWVIYMKLRGGGCLRKRGSALPHLQNCGYNAMRHQWGTLGVVQILLKAICSFLRNALLHQLQCPTQADDVIAQAVLCGESSQECSPVQNFKAFKRQIWAGLVVLTTTQCRQGDQILPKTVLDWSQVQVFCRVAWSQQTQATLQWQAKEMNGATNGTWGKFSSLTNSVEMKCSLSLSSLSPLSLSLTHTDTFTFLTIATMPVWLLAKIPMALFSLWKKPNIKQMHSTDDI